MTTATAIALRPQDLSELDRYMTEVRRHPMLNRDEEQRLAHLFADKGDLAAAHQLVIANLRFVVKVANEYKGYGLKLIDLIQEGNIGLMQAVKKFDPSRNYRLISYAVWWIRAEIQGFILRSWSLVKMGSGKARRKLFFKLRSERSRLEQEWEGELDSQTRRTLLAERLDVSADEVGEMECRLAARDFSLDAPVNDGSDLRHVDMLDDTVSDNAEHILLKKERVQLVTDVVTKARDTLNEKERYILDKRMLSDEQVTLAEIGNHFGVSRERIRQLEGRVLGKLRKALPAPAAFA